MPPRCHCGAEVERAELSERCRLLESAGIRAGGWGSAGTRGAWLPRTICEACAIREVASRRDRLLAEQAERERRAAIDAMLIEPDEDLLEVSPNPRYNGRPLLNRYEAEKRHGRDVARAMERFLEAQYGPVPPPDLGPSTPPWEPARDPLADPLKLTREDVARLREEHGEIKAAAMISDASLRALKSVRVVVEHGEPGGRARRLRVEAERARDGEWRDRNGRDVSRNDDNQPARPETREGEQIVRAQRDARRFASALQDDQRMRDPNPEARQPDWYGTPVPNPNYPARSRDDWAPRELGPDPDVNHPEPVPAEPAMTLSDYASRRAPARSKRRR